MENKIYNGFVELVNASKEDSFLLDMIGEAMENFPKYVNSVYTMGVQMTIARMRLDGEELRDRIATLDSARNSCHQCAIDSCDRLNRYCGMVGTAPFCPVSKDRYLVGDFAAIITSIIFLKQVEEVTSLDQLVDLMDEMAPEILALEDFMC